ncbi:MAG TPA: ribosomal protein S18-alanine N-acetyltransferase [Terracidiphilus sp.]|jgi:ribosomal-protein-alanine N-acetyltransferase|nr:ribosomal protein S18-alanine N-acetyltransferase [Terracidiphilus sp.]
MSPGSDLPPGASATPRAPIEIRPLAATDIDAVLALAATLPEAPHWSREHYSQSVFSTAPLRRIALAAYHTRSREVVGFAIASLIPPEAELETVAVAGPWQRQGIAAHLLAALVHELKVAEVSEVRLEVRVSNQPAIDFYQSQNFKQIGVRDRYYADPEEDALIMSLLLS